VVVSHLAADVLKVGLLKKGENDKKEKKNLGSRSVKMDLYHCQGHL